MAKIAIGAGHGLKTYGKRCLKSLDPNETREWVLNDRVADEVIRLLESAGHTVYRVDDPTGKVDVSLNERVRRVNNWKPDYYLSIHHNAGAAGGTAGGTVMFKYNGTGGVTKQAQEAIYKHAIERGKLKGNRYDGTLDGNFQVIRETSVPAGLIECGFMDSKIDIGYILDPEWSKKIALGIAEGICEVFGGTIKVNDTTKPEQKPAEAKPVTPPVTKKTIYRVRKSWADVKSQKGAFTDLKNAKKCANDNPGYYVFDESGKAIYPVHTSDTTNTLKDLGKVNITMQAYTYKWWPAVVNDSDWVGQGDNVAIKYLAVKVDKGTIKAQACTQKNGWLPALTFGNSYNLNDLNNGVIGDGSPIQALKLDYISPEGYKEQNVYYCVSDTTGKLFYPEQVDVNVGSGMDGYAGVKGKNIDKIIAHIE